MNAASSTMSRTPNTITQLSRRAVAIGGSLVLLIALALGYLIITHAAQSAAPSQPAVAGAAPSASSDSSAARLPGRVSYKVEHSSSTCAPRSGDVYGGVTSGSDDADQHMVGQAYHRLLARPASQSTAC